MTSRALIKMLAGNPWSNPWRLKKTASGGLLIYFNGDYVTYASDTHPFKNVEPSQITSHLALLNARFPYDASKPFWEWYYKHAILAQP